MRRRLKAFTLIELLVVIAIIALLISILLPSLSRARELSKRLVCGSNMKGIGTSAKIYANDNSEKWMSPGFARSLVDQTGVNYLPVVLAPSPDPETGEVGYDRWAETTDDGRGAAGLTGGSSVVSVTRAYWMMVRSGDITVEQFICPSSAADEPDRTDNIELYYDFEAFSNVSYGYQVPFGPRDTRPREGMDSRQIMAADKGPFSYPVQFTWNVGKLGQKITLNDSPKLWRPLNSNNHGGKGNGEGQNCLYGDGHATFNKTPTAGVDSDNIYTTITLTGDLTWADYEGYIRIHGATPHDHPIGPPYPGQGAFCTGAGCYAATDTLIYP